MKEIFVSIIVAYYKKKIFLKDTIESIHNQTFKNYEIIIIDDENSQESKSVLRDIIKHYDKINLIINDKNIGAGPSRNKALSFAKGDFIAFCDSDDLWKKNKLEKQIEFMLNKNIEFSHTDYEIIDEQNRILNLRLCKNDLAYCELLNSCDIGLSTVMIKKKLFNDPSLRFANLTTKEDFVLWLKIAKKGIRIFGFKEVLTSWRVVKNSLSSSISQKVIDGFKVYRIYMKFSIFKSLYCLFKLSLNYLYKSFK